MIFYWQNMSHKPASGAIGLHGPSHPVQTPLANDVTVKAGEDLFPGQGQANRTGQLISDC